MFRNKGIAFKLTFFVIASCAIIFSLIFSYNYSNSRKIIIHEIEKNAVNLAMATAGKIESYILPIQKIPKTVALILAHPDINQADITNLLEVIVANKSNIYGSAIAFEPYCFDSNSSYYSNLDSTNYNYFKGNLDVEIPVFKSREEVGKGVPEAPFMAVTKTLIKGFAMQTDAPAEILRQVNEEAVQNNETCMFVTVFLTILNIKTGEIKFANTRHNPPLIVRKNTEVSFLEVKSDCAVGVIENPDFTTEKLVLKRDDLILFYTDGVTDAFNGEEFSEDRLKNALTSLVSLPVEQITSGILENVLLFSGEVPQSDDLTMLTLRYKL